MLHARHMLGCVFAPLCLPGQTLHSPQESSMLTINGGTRQHLFNSFPLRLLKPETNLRVTRFIIFDVLDPETYFKIHVKRQEFQFYSEL
jgi:hypothetical protein